jgi:hypothetical protein
MRMVHVSGMETDADQDMGAMIYKRMAIDGKEVFIFEAPDKCGEVVKHVVTRKEWRERERDRHRTWPRLIRLWVR